MAKSNAATLTSPPTEVSTKPVTKPSDIDQDVVEVSWEEASRAPYNLKGVHSLNPNLDMLLNGVVREFVKNVEIVSGLDGKKITVPKRYLVRYNQDYVNRRLVVFLEELGLISLGESGSKILDEGLLSSVINGNDHIKGLKRYLSEDVVRQQQEEMRQEERKKLKAVVAFVENAPAEGVSVPQRYIEFYRLTENEPVPDWMLEEYEVDPSELTYFPSVKEKELVGSK